MRGRRQLWSNHVQRHPGLNTCLFRTPQGQAAYCTMAEAVADSLQTNKDGRRRQWERGGVRRCSQCAKSNKSSPVLAVKCRICSGSQRRERPRATGRGKQRVGRCTLGMLGGGEWECVKLREEGLRATHYFQLGASLPLCL